MKKFIFSIFLLLSIAPNAFAGADTDAICADDTKAWLIYQNVKVEYSGEIPQVDQIYKKWDSQSMMDGPIDPKEHYTLYYIVNISGKNGRGYVRSELYSYHCKTKVAKQLLAISIDHNIEDYYEVDLVSSSNLIMVGRASGIAIWPTSTVIGYDIRTNKKTFSIQNTTNIFPERNITWYISGKWMWYVYYANPNYTDIASLFRIDKKTKKVTKL